MSSTFSPSRRGGRGSPLVCLHGFTETWRSWELILPALEAQHDVLALTLPGHAGGPPLDGHVDEDTIAALLGEAPRRPAPGHRGDRDRVRAHPPGPGRAHDRRRRR